MKKILVLFFGVAFIMLMGSIACAEVIQTYNGPITVTPGTVAYGEVGALVDPTGIGNFGTDNTYHGASFPGETAAVQQAGSTLDHYWVQSRFSGATGDIVWQLNTAVNAVLGFPGTDHGPLPWENLEYLMYGSNDQATWDVGALTAIYHDGWDPNLVNGDFYATRWDFSQSYQYFKTVGHIGVVFDNAGNPWNGGYDPEMDGIAAPSSAVPEPSTMLLLGSGLIGLAGYGRRRLLKK
jgi:hypothetical protein